MSIKPKLRTHIFKKITNILQENMDYPYKTCITCDHFLEQQEKCNLYDQRPPARVIAFGCDSYKDDNYIPF